ncbi:MAG: hypothetical protein KDE53_30615, partial [Caldilineaceae bacterium]|nr:hypothetical protein [Caldilineaceae bacterium]
MPKQKTSWRSRRQVKPKRLFFAPDLERKLAIRSMVFHNSATMLPSNIKSGFSQNRLRHFIYEFDT